MRTSKSFYQQELSTAYKYLLIALGVIVFLFVLADFGWGSYFVAANDPTMVRKIPTCGSFADYAAVQADLAQHPEDLEYLDGPDKDLIPCNVLYDKAMKIAGIVNEK